MYTGLHRNIYIVLEFNSEMVYDEELKGEERKIVSTRLYRPEFANFTKICEGEGKSVNAKLREMVGDEIKKDSKLTGKKFLRKIKEDKENAEEKLMSKQKEWNFKIWEENKNVQ